MLYLQSMLLTIVMCAAGLLSLVKSHVDFTKLGPIRVEDLWCFDPDYKVGVPNMYKKLKNCISDPVGNHQECNSVYDQFCKVNGIGRNECQVFWNMITPTHPESMNCANALMIALGHLETRLEECMSTSAYAIWESHLLTNQGPHHTTTANWESHLHTTPRRLLDTTTTYQSPDALTYQVGDKHSIARHHNVANYVHQAMDILVSTDERCLEVYDIFRGADSLALIGNLRVNGLSPEEVHGQRYEDLVAQFEGHAVVNHGDIQMHFTPGVWWNMFNGLAMSGPSNHLQCHKFTDIDGNERNSCYRGPWTKHY